MPEKFYEQLGDKQKLIPISLNTYCSNVYPAPEQTGKIAMLYSARYHNAAFFKGAFFKPISKMP